MKENMKFFTVYLAWLRHNGELIPASKFLLIPYCAWQFYVLFSLECDLGKNSKYEGETDKIGSSSIE